MLDLQEIARSEEGRLALGMSEIADQFRPCAGGTACRGAPGTWVNTMVGMGFAGEVSADDLSGAVRWYEDAGIEPRAEVSPFAHESLTRHLEAMRFSVRTFENVFFREVGTDAVAAPYPAPPGLSIVLLSEQNPAQLDDAARVVAGGFAAPGTQARPEDVEVFKRCAVHPRTAYLAAIMDGRVVGAGAVEFAGDVCALFGLSVHPDHRRRAVQQTLIRERLIMARDRGAKIATISSRPGVATERNVRRMGFQVAYTRVVMARAGDGLVASRG